RRIVETMLSTIRPEGFLKPFGSVPNFHVREIPIYGDLILSPMDGFSDLPFRLICRELGSAMSYTEFVNVINLQGHGKPHSVSALKLKYDPSERPMTFQIYGYDEDLLVDAAIRLQDLGPDIIDINMGCYVKDIARRGAGSGMLLYPDKIARVFARLSNSLRVPVTGKIRLGWDDTKRNHVQVAKILEENGASLIAVHGRTKAQAYQGAADWDAIAEVKQAVKIPVLGNGDVRTVADIARIQAHTGCNGVMIGRAAIGNPWIFARKDREQVTAAEKIAVLRRHLALNLDFYGPDLGLLLFRKHAARYVQNLTGEEKPRVPLFTCKTLEEFDRMLIDLTCQTA
ncbi:MAG: tRNA dihydrouridine synthase DusB, partial [Chloroflexota bacterium]|nr:tRNA dihydrouridine synthase DusB [Chloroflexota bacterium]